MPLPLVGVRVLDWTWLNAGGKGPRHLSLFGAEVIHLEWKDRLDFFRFNPPFHRRPDEPAFGEARGGYETLPVPSINRSASFNNNHVGKYGISLNMHHPKGKELFRELLKTADVVVDNFTATTMERWGLGFEQMRRVKPDIIYVQAPGFGRKGPYHGYRSYGPTAAAVSGLTWMSGLPDRYPCGYGFSYMDVCGPYFLAMAIMAALRQRNRTGQGIYVDSSQAGPAFLLTGTAILDWSANQRAYVRTGNRSPYIMAAPHGAYRCSGEEAWIAIACFTEEQWQGLVRAMGRPRWANDPSFSTLAERYRHQDELDAHVERWTLAQERYELMARLQQAGVPAGVGQDTRDRADNDPQLRHRGYVVEVPHTEAGPYRTEGHAGRFSETQPTPGGLTGRGTACYAEDNQRIYGELMGMTEAHLAALAEEGVI